MSYQGMSERELSLAIRAAKKLRESQRVKLETCPACDGQGQIESGTAKDGPESCGEGHAVFATCPACDGATVIEIEE